ncbi:hypothetical protein KKB99_07935 [bacterium]|nr:hypothetical protein [bacterium]MBU1025921.1 hypothetical protein [bacterium]
MANKSDNDGMEETTIKYVSYFSVFSKYKVRIIIVTILAYILMFVWCTLGIPPMKKKWKSSVGLIYPLQKSSLAIKRSLGALDIPIGGLGGILGGSGTAYNNIPVLQSRRVIIQVIDKVPGVREELDEDAQLDDERLAKSLVKKLKIDDSMDGFLQISVFWSNPDTAAEIANTLVDVMQTVLMELNRDNAHYISAFLKTRIEFIEEKMDIADEDVRAFKEQSKILAVDEQAVEMIKTYSQLQIDMTQAEMEFSEAATRYKLLNDEKANLEQFIKENVPKKDIFDLSQITQDPVINLYDNGMILDTVPAVEALQDDSISRLRRDVGEISLEIDHKRMLFTDDHPDLISLKKRLYDAKRMLYQELKNFTQSAVLSLDIEKLAFQAKRDVIASIVKDLDDKIESYPENEAKLLRLLRDQKVYEEVYTLLMQEYEQALLAEDRPETTFDILDPAVPVYRPARPRKGPYSMGFAIIMFAVILMYSFHQEKGRIAIKNEG